MSMGPVLQPHGATPTSPSQSDMLPLETKMATGANLATHLEVQSDARTPISPTQTPLTPDSMRAQRDLQLLRTIWDKNMQNKPVKHDRVCVLLLSWREELDDLKVKPEVDQLQAVFTDLYGFKVTREVLDNELPKHQLNCYLSTFMYKNDGKDTLLIVYYAGHGSYRQNSVHMHATTGLQTENEEQRNCIAWSGAESNLTSSQADVLVIFDCCEAGGIGGHKVRSYSKPNFEFIAACGMREKAARPGEKSFTSALMWALRELICEYPFTSITLVDKIKKYPHRDPRQNPELLRRDEVADGIVWIAPIKAGEPQPESIARSEHRDPRHEYIDLRLNFYRPVKAEDVKEMARTLSRLVNNEPTFEAKHIALLDVSSTFSKAVSIFRNSTATGKRKRSLSTRHNGSTSTTVIYSGEARRGLLESTLVEAPTYTLPLAKRPRCEELQPELVVEQQGALYHFRMFLNCSLQSVGSQIGRVADRVRPPLRNRDVPEPIHHSA
ncbi:uncharacterized protein BDR25DRAFT_303768 [Lindgomyces ingoldianus]|uniref:Uncharacterized protein n=1 Tax=Lindgomyces ingoldianus TaxID=673940 RepID=A0ACB6QUU1_9PLEO|nr:uncharacterized protein BDR25DRAFT_303768 [Lindgomyces ingoldianus]KAF2470784.1 hypothetical protein BDR25DRAFT_303768 [Lindgomyces ingoldianus]